MVEAEQIRVIEPVSRAIQETIKLSNVCKHPIIFKFWISKNFCSPAENILQSLRNRLQNFRKSIGNFIFWACKKRPYIVPRKQNKIPDRFSRKFFFWNWFLRDVFRWGAKFFWNFEKNFYDPLFSRFECGQHINWTLASWHDLEQATSLWSSAVKQTPKVSPLLSTQTAYA